MAKTSKHKPPEGPTLIGVLQEKIRGSGLSLNEIARQSGVADSQLSRFMRGESALSLRTAEKLVAFFRLKLVDSEQAEATNIKLPKPKPAEKPKKGGTHG